VQPDVVIKANDVFGDIALSLAVVGIIMLPYTLHFQIQKEAFHHGVVPAIPLAAHAAANAMLIQ
jgi:hypothetical protein